MRKMLTMLGSFGLVASNGFILSNVVSCGDKFKLPSEPKDLEEAKKLFEEYSKKSDEFTKKFKEEIENAKISDKDKEFAEFSKKSEVAQKAYLYGSLVFAYSCKVSYFENKDKNQIISDVDAMLKQMDENLKPLMTDKNYKNFTSIFEWAKKDPR